MYILAIDPGNIETGYSVINTDDYKPLVFGKVNNQELEKMFSKSRFNHPEYGAITISGVVIELVKSYGMLVGQSVFDTCIEIGRLAVLCERFLMVKPYYIPRKEYVTNLCGSSKAKDSNVIQYLIDRFAPNEPNRGKGSKSKPGWFYGFKADVWQSYALGIYFIDKEYRNVL